MNNDSRIREFCEYEQAVAAALRTGAFPEDLLAHVGSCPVCTEVMIVSQSLMQDLEAGEIHVPDAGLVWRRAQAAARQQAIAKATRPIRIARIGALVAAAIAVAWLAIPGLNTGSWMPDLGHSLSSLDHSLSALATATFALGVVGSLIVISLSSWYLARQG